MKNNTITTALLNNSTIANTATRRITGDIVGVENFAQWKLACENLYRECYKYERAKVMYALDKVESINANNAFITLQSVLDLLGEVNGHKIAKNQVILDMVSHCAVTRKTALTGHAETVKSELDNVKKQIRDIHAGMGEDYVANLYKKLEELTEELRLAKKEVGSANPYPSIVSFNTFRGKLEDTLVSLIEKQQAKSWEELEAEAQAKKAERRAKTKAKRQAANK